MLINENRGSYGMFSRAGRNSTEKFHILMKKDEILNGTGRKFKPPNLFSQTKEETTKYNTDNLDEPNEIFFDQHIEKKSKEKKGKKKSENIFEHKKSEDYMQKFLDIRNKNKRLNLVPCCTKYDPKNEFIWKKVRQTPTWTSTLPKNKSIKPSEVLIPKFYIENEFKLEHKNFVDMSRQMQRKSFSIQQNKECENDMEDLYFYNRTMTNKTFYKSNSNNNNPPNNMFHTSRSGFGSFNSNRKILQSAGTSTRKNLVKKKNLSEDTPARDNFSQGNYTLNECSPSRKSSSSLLKQKIKQSSINHSHLGKNWIIINRNSKSAHPLNRRWNKINGPDFRKTISRETRDKLYDDKKRVMPFSIPPFEKTRPRSIMLVKYDAKHYKPRSSKRPTSTPSIEVSFDPYKLLDKYNNHKKPSTPNFRLMSSRPEDKVLPAYMKSLHSRQGTNMMTEKALKMNKFSEGGFIQNTTSFWPKKSYNKIVNLNLLSSKKFVENVGLNQETNKAKLNEVNDYIQKSMKFYNKNFDDLIKESMLNKFDCITYKHIRRENKLDTGDLDKFLLNFEKLDL